MERVRSSDGTTIGFERHGSGEPVLLVHGATGSVESWALVAPLLADRFEVVVMDRRGRGSSGDGDDYSMDLEADDVEAVLEAVGDPVHLVGHSFGASLGLFVAARGARLRSLVAYEPPIATERHTPDGLVDRAESLIRDGALEAAAELFLTGAAAVPPEELEIIKSLPEVWQRVTEGVPTVPREARALDANPVDLEALRRVAVPVMLLVGAEQDAPVYLDGLDEIERTLPDVRRVKIPGQRHLAPGFAPDAFADLVASFIEDVRAR